MTDKIYWEIRSLEMTGKERIKLLIAQNEPPSPSPTFHIQLIKKQYNHIGNPLVGDTLSVDLTKLS